MTTFFTSDQHFFHKQILMHCSRPYKSESHMRKDIITRHNQTVRKKDTVYIIGDLAMIGPSMWEHLKGVVQQLNGIKHLIFGNHDELKWQRYLDIGFTSVHSAHWMSIAGVKVVMAHDPAVYCAIDPDAILLHGHIHTLYKSIPDQRVVNVGVDMWNFTPITIEQIKNEINL